MRAPKTGSFLSSTTLHIILFMLLLVLFSHCRTGNVVKPLSERLQPAPRESGFKMDGYWVWGGSLIKVDSTYHLFASRWPKANEFPRGYRQHSEIVRATAANISGPYQFREVVIGERDSLYWDSNMAHNPTIHKIDSTYVMFYIGSDFTTLHPDKENLYRSIGYATAQKISGPWIRCENPIINQESNNPAVFVEKNGSIKLMFRDAPLHVLLATAPSYKGPYTIKNDNVWPDCKLEDFYLFKHNNQYHCICEDNVGKISGHVRWGIHLFSNNGINDWKEYDPVVVYDHDLKYKDGSVLNCVRRERPQLLVENERIVCLLTGIYDGQNSWCQPVKVYPHY